MHKVKVTHANADDGQFYLVKWANADASRVTPVAMGTELEVAEVANVDGTQWLRSKKPKGWFAEGYTECATITLNLVHPDHPNYLIGTLDVEPSTTAATLKAKVCVATGLREDCVVLVTKAVIPEDCRTGNLASYVGWLPANDKDPVSTLGYKHKDTLNFTYLGVADFDLKPHLTWKPPVFSDSDDEAPIHDEAPISLAVAG